MEQNDTIILSTKNVIGSGGHPKPPSPPPPRLYNGAGVRLSNDGKSKPESMEPMSVFVFFAFMFCAFCLGVAVGGHFGN